VGGSEPVGQTNGPEDKRPLPSFAAPPVSEVALSAMFPPLNDLHAGHLGAYWQSVRADFPKLQQQPPLSPAEPEVLGSSAGPTFSVQLVPAFTTPRFWLISDDESLLVQVQSDRLVLNWRKVAADCEYPRYSLMRERFEAEWTRFTDYLTTESIRPPETMHGEITYVNTITPSSVWSEHADADKVFSQFRSLALPSEVVSPEDVRLLERFVFPNRSNETTGRLYVQLDPVRLASTGDPAFNLSLTARGARSDDANDLLDFMDAGRERIVQVFTAMTTVEAHAMWGRLA